MRGGAFAGRKQLSKVVGHCGVPRDQSGRNGATRTRPGVVSAQNGWVLYLTGELLVSGLVSYWSATGQQPAARCSAVTASDIEPTCSAPAGARRAHPGPPTRTVTDGRIAGTAATWRASAISGQCAQIKTAQAPPRLTAAASASEGTRAPSTLASIARSASAAHKACSGRVCSSSGAQARSTGLEFRGAGPFKVTDRSAPRTDSANRCSTSTPLPVASHRDPAPVRTGTSTASQVQSTPCL